MTIRTLSALLLLTLAACAGEGTSGPSGAGNDNGVGTGSGSGDGDDGPADDGNSGTPSGGGGDVTAAFQAIAEAECSDAFACRAQWPTAEGSFTDVWGADEAACVQEGLEYYDAAAIQESIDNGTITFDAASADACISALQSLGAPVCSTYWDDGLAYPDECFSMISGTVAENGACTNDYECAGDSSYCGESDTCVTD